MSRSLKKPWLESYLDYVKDTENPHSYNIWSGISAISSAAKRKVHLWYHEYQVFPNQYIVLVGPPGIGKGRAIKPAVELVKGADVANYLSDRITAEKIIEKLATGFSATASAVINAQGAVQIVPDHTACILAKELPVFLGSSDWMHSLLCQLWDENEFEHQTKNKGSNIIKNLCVGMLGGCVPDYIRSLTRDSLAPITGGFTARCIFVYATQKSQFIADGWGQPNGTKSSLYSALLDDLRHISYLTGEMLISGPGKDLWRQKYVEWQQKQDEFESDALANFKSRLPSHVLKAAMTMCLSEADDLIITAKHLQKAIDLVEDVCTNVDVTFRAVGESPINIGMDKVMRFIEKRGVASKGEMLKYVGRSVTPDQLDMILKVLTTMEPPFCTEGFQGKRFMYTHNPTLTVKTP